MNDLSERLRTEDTKEHHGRRLICGCAPLRHEGADALDAKNQRIADLEKRHEYTGSKACEERIEQLEAALQHFYDYGYDRGRCEQALKGEG